MCASISCCLLTSHPAAHNGGCADGPGTASGWATHNVACKLPQLAPASLCPPPGCVFPSLDFGGAAGCNHNNFCLEKLPSYPPRIGAGNPAIPTMAGRSGPRRCAAALIRATSRRNSSSISAKAAAGELAPIPSSGPMVRSCALSGMGGWHWRDKWLQKNAVPSTTEVNGTARKLCGNILDGAAWAALLRGFETRQFGKIAKISGPRISTSEGRQDVEITGFEGDIVISLSIAAATDGI